MDLLKGIKQFTRKHYTVFFYAFYVALVYLFWFLYAWRGIKTVGDAMHIFYYGSVYLVGFWINKQFLFPRFFLRGRLWGYFLMSCASFFVLYFVQSACDAKSFA